MVHGFWNPEIGRLKWFVTCSCLDFPLILIPQEKSRRAAQKIRHPARSKNEPDIGTVRDELELIFLNLKNSPVPIDNVKKTSTLLESILVIMARVPPDVAVKEFSQELSFMMDRLLDTINRLLLEKQSPELIQLQHLSLKTFHQLLKRTTNWPESATFADILEKLVDHLTAVKCLIGAIAKDDPQNDSMGVTLNSSALLLLKCIHNVAIKSSVVNGKHVQLSGKFVGVIRCFLYYGLPHYDLSSVLPVQLYPAPLSQFKDESNNASRKRRSKLDDDDDNEDDDVFRQDTFSGYSTSECSSSEFEDSGPRNEWQNKKLYVNIRMYSYECLQASIELFDIRQVFGFWSFLFPDTEFSQSQFSVLKTISHDPSNRVRIAALNFMYAFFDYGRQYVRVLVQDSAGDGGNRPTASFTPLSVSLTAMIKELHRFFRYMLLKESGTSMLIVIYKVLSLIVTITPYGKLKLQGNGDILSPLFHQNSFMLDQKAIQIKNLSLALCVKLFGLPVPPAPLEWWLLDTDTGRETMDKILGHCYEFITAKEYILLIIESIKLFISVLKHTAFATRLFCRLNNRWNLEKLCAISIQITQMDKAANNLVMQNLMCRFLYAIGVYFKDLVANHNDDETIRMIFGGRDIMLSFISQWYLTVLDTSIFNLALVQQDLARCQHSCLVTLINLISLIPEAVFCRFSESTRFQFIAILISLAKIDETAETPAPANDESTNLHVYTKSTAIRCLSILQSLRCCADDAGFTGDLLDICLDVLQTKRYRSLPNKKKINLLENTLWAMANICDCIKKCHDPKSSIIDTAQLNRVAFSLSELFDQIRDGSIAATDDIRTNLVRCSGIVIYLVLVRDDNENETNTGTEEPPPIFQKHPENHLEPKVMLKMIDQTAEIMMKNNSCKLQWNICIAFSYLFPLERFVRLTAPAGLLEKVFQEIYRRFTTTANHKVQSYSIYTITTITALQHFGEHLKELWLTTVDVFIRNYYIVTENSRRSWMEKFSHAIGRLHRDYVVAESDQDVQDKLHQLMEFLAQETGTDDDAGDPAGQIRKLSSLF